MPALEAGSNAKVLVTGANGYIAMWVIHYLLEQGYGVRGTARSEEKGNLVKKHFREYAENGKLELAIVEDVSKAGAYDEAVKGVDAIIQAASPVVLTEGDPDVLIQPALRGTLGVLQSSLTYGKSVKRFLFLSSLSAIADLADENSRVFTEKDWNDACPENVRKLGKDAPPLEKYTASKVLSERAAWEFVEKHKNDIQWDMCALHPSFVFGPYINDWNDFKSLNTSNQLCYNIMLDPTPKPKQFLETSIGCVDVRDVALSHVLALRKPEAGGERFLISAYHCGWQELIEGAHALNPPLSSTRSLTPIQPDIQVVRTQTYDSSKAERLLGIQWRPKEEMIRDTLENFIKRVSVSSGVNSMAAAHDSSLGFFRDSDAQ